MMQKRSPDHPLYISISRCREERAYDMPCGHMHPHHELYFLLEGERRYFIDGQIYTVCAGDVVLIPKEILHHTTSISNAPHERYLLEFGDALIPKNLHEQINQCFLTRLFTLSAEQRVEFKQLFRKLDTEYHSKNEYADALLHAYTTELLVMLMRQMHTDNRAPESTQTKVQSNTEQLIESATTYITSHLQDALTLPLVANEFHLSHSYFSRIFKLYTGFGFNEYLTHMRVQRAAELLKNSSASVGEIAETCGFNDANYFSSVFKRTIGISPKKYRMQ